MKKRYQIDSGFLEFLILVLLAMVLMIYLNGCSAQALQVAKDKASPENVDYHDIKRVVSGVKNENGDISVCLELTGPGEGAKPNLNTIALPLSGFAGDSDAIEKLELRPGEGFADDTIHYWVPYWYPMEKTRRGCESVGPVSPSSDIVLPVENIRVNNTKRHQLYSLLTDLRKNQPTQESIYEVRFIAGEKEPEKEAETESAKESKTRAEGSENVSLIYWPAPIGLQEVRPVLITGIYDDNRTHLYYLLVPVAFVGDVVVITAYMALRISLESLGR